MTDNKYSHLLFEHINKELDGAAKRIRQRIFSVYRDVPWTAEQYRLLEPLIREELHHLMQEFLNSLDNVGGVLPEGVLGFDIKAYDEDEDGNILEAPIREGAFPDYGDMWREFLQKKRQ